MPSELEHLLSLLEGEERIVATGSWTRAAPGQWSLPIEAVLSVPATEFMPMRTGWRVVVSFVSETDPVEIYPCSSTGVTDTFPHQMHNGEPAGNDLWRTGKLCLDRPEAAYGKDDWAGQPPDIVGKIVWHLSRLLLWIDAAAAGKLRQDGDPFEVPPTPKSSALPIVGFNESPDDLEHWLQTEARWGGVSLSNLPHTSKVSVTTAFKDSGGRAVTTRSWGAWSDLHPSQRTGIWLRLDRIPIVEPWGLPTTWQELNSLVEIQNFDLADILEAAGISLRKRTHKNEQTILLLGFPVEEHIGELPSRMHWLAIENLPLQARHAKVNGFRPNESNYRRLDRSVATSHGRLDWIKTMNWASDQIRRRGPGSARLSSSRIVMLGAGALGSAVAENLLRMGNRELVILDGERLEVGNLTRHALGLEAVGRNKAIALAGALNSSMIDGRAIGHATSFPPSDALVVANLRAANVIVDCTGSDEVLRRMAEFDWGTEKTFVSLAVTWRAEGLLAYTASELSFPHVDAVTRMADLNTPRPSPSESTMEGIGCWHPVFPATAEDMRLWASYGTRVIREAIEKPMRKLIYYRQQQDGQISLIAQDA